MLSEAKSSRTLIDFLQFYLEQRFKDNIFSGSYGPERAENDGKAKMAKEVYDLLGGLID